MKARKIFIASIKSIVPCSLLTFVMACSSQNTSNFSGKNNEVKLITLDPGHFHAALVQKTMYPQIDSNVYVYAPAGSDLDLHLARIENFNKRENNPTRWHEIVYSGPDFLSKMFAEKPGNVLVLSGNNILKTNYINSSIEAGLNVLADKPMAITTGDFEKLRQAFNAARINGMLLYDIMTERYEITNMIQRDLIHIPELFGELETGSPENPAIVQESVHYFYKIVSGSTLIRPSWFFDVNQEGEGLVDVATHLVDLIQWECFPNQIINYEKEIAITDARHWPTPITISQFKKVTQTEWVPDYLQSVTTDSLLNIYSNGEILYKIKGMHARIAVKWDFESSEGHGDTHYSMIRGTKSDLTIRQGKEENFKPTLYIKPHASESISNIESTISQVIKDLQTKYAGLNIVRKGDVWEVIIPETFKVGHEAHFGQVMEKYLRFLKEGSLPEWEVPNMLAKYYTTTKGLEMARKKQ